MEGDYVRDIKGYMGYIVKTEIRSISQKTLDLLKSYTKGWWYTYFSSNEVSGLHVPLEKQPNVGQYTSLMDGMGNESVYITPTMGFPRFHLQSPNRDQWELIGPTRSAYAL